MGHWPPTSLPAQPVPGLTSIVVLALNECEYTERCLRSVAQYTSAKVEIVLVDNGSTDATPTRMRELQAELLSEYGIPMRIVTHAKNMGFGGGSNSGIAASRGEFVVLLNNDTVVTPGWLESMLEVCARHPHAGIVGPRSNNVAGDQLVADISYDPWTLDGLDTFAREWSDTHVQQARRVYRLIGFCMLVRRSVFDTVGGFDVRFGLGNFEDDDLCLRAGVAGFECWQADQSYVHHYGSRTFAGAGIDHTASMAQNWRIFARRWRIDDGTGPMGTGYIPAKILNAESFDPARHFAPMVVAPDDGSTIDTGSATSLNAVLLTDVAQLSAALTAAMSSGQLRASGTLVIPIAAMNDDILASLEHEVSKVESALGLPAGDMAIVVSDGHNDAPLLLGCQIALVAGEGARDRALHAASLGVHVIDSSASNAASELDDLVTQLAQSRAA